MARDGRGTPRPWRPVRSAADRDEAILRILRSCDRAGTTIPIWAIDERLGGIHRVAPITVARRHGLEHTLERADPGESRYSRASTAG